MVLLLWARCGRLTAGLGKDCSSIRQMLGFMSNLANIVLNFLSRLVKPSAIICVVGTHQILSAGIDCLILRISIKVLFSDSDGASETMQSYRLLQSVIRYNGTLSLSEPLTGMPVMISCQ